MVASVEGECAKRHCLTDSGGRASVVVFGRGGAYRQWALARSLYTPGGCWTRALSPKSSRSPSTALLASLLTMSSNGSESTLAAPQPPKSGVRTVLQYTGIPPSWLDKRPRLPSRNWLIFLSVTSTVAGYYIYDRQQCKKIRQEYVEKVKDLAEQPMGSMELPRLVTVYGAKWVGDQEYDRSMRYFRKYVKVRAHAPLSSLPHTDSHASLS